MRSLLVLLLLPLLAAHGASASAPASQTAQVQQDVTTLVRAGYDGDVETMLRFTHPALVERLGGLSAARAAMERVLEQAARVDVELESFSFPRTPEFLDGRERRFAVVPTLSVIRRRDGQRLESLNFLLGVRERGTDRWSYVEGSMIDARNVRALFPDFPEGYAFPPFHRRKV